MKVDIADENVLQPLLVSTSAVELASETVKMILRSTYPLLKLFDEALG